MLSEELITLKTSINEILRHVCPLMAAEVVLRPLITVELPLYL